MAFVEHLSDLIRRKCLSDWLDLYRGGSNDTQRFEFFSAFLVSGCVGVQIKGAAMQVSKVGQLPNRNILNIFLGKQNSKSFPQRFLWSSSQLMSSTPGSALIRSL